MNRTERTFLFVARNLNNILLLLSNMAVAFLLSFVGITSSNQINKTVFISILILVCLSICLAIIDWYAKYHVKYYEEPFHNFCIKLFDKHFENWNGTTTLSDKFRVTIYMIKREKRTEKEYLEYLCRHQYGKIRKPRVRTFSEGEGSAGIVLETGQSSRILESLPEYDDKNPEDYIRAHQRLYNLQREKVCLLGRKARDYWSVPIKNFDVEKRMVAVVSFDSMLPDTFSSEKFKNETSVRILDEVESFSSAIRSLL